MCIPSKENYWTRNNKEQILQEKQNLTLYSFVIKQQAVLVNKSPEILGFNFQIENLGFAILF